MSEILRAINVTYESTVIDPDAAGLRLPPFDDPDIAISSYDLHLESPESFGNRLDHPVCLSCPLYTPEAEVLIRTLKSIECLGPVEVTDEIGEDGLYHMKGTIEVHEYAQGTIHGNCGVAVDTRRKLEETVFIPDRLK